MYCFVETMRKLMIALDFWNGNSPAIALFISKPTLIEVALYMWILRWFHRDQTIVHCKKTCPIVSISEL